MRRITPRRPSPSMIVALAALLLALASSASAGLPARITGLISGAKIRPHSIAANRLKNDTLTGAQVNESALGQVPSALAAATAGEAVHAKSATTATDAANAAHATSADTASNASQFGGLGPAGYFLSSNGVRYSAAMSKGDPDKTLATVGPLTLTASCTDDAGKTHAVLGATSSANGVWLIGNTLNSGESAVIQSLDTATADEERVLPILTATDSAQSFAIEGVSVTVANALGKDCRFWGILVEDAD